MGCNAFLALLVISVLGMGVWMSRDLPGLGPLSDGVEAALGESTAWLMERLHDGVYTYFVVAAVYFLVSLAALVDSVRGPLTGGGSSDRSTDTACRPGS